MAYTKQRSSWSDYPITTTPVLAANLNAWETTMLQLKQHALNIEDDYGAVGDNSTNNATAIANAVSDAASMNRPVLIPDGTFRVGSAVSIPDFVNVVGMGQSSVLRASGNHYVFNLNPANRSSFSNLTIDAASAQASGGAFNFANAGSNVWLDGIYFGNNLFYGVDLALGSSQTAFILRRLRWNGVAGCNTAIRVGGGGFLVTDVYLSDCIGTASTTSDMVTWLSIPANVDTFKMRGALFIKGTTGFGLGTTSLVTNLKFSDVTVDSMTGKGIDSSFVRECAFSGSEVSVCGSSTLPGLEIGANTNGLRFVNGVIQGCVGPGAIIRNGATNILLSESTVSDNNTSNTAFTDGIAVAAGTSKFQITNNVSGNNVLLTTGHQKNGISVATGASTDYVITGNRCSGNETNNVVDDQGTGTNKFVANNTPASSTSVNSASTITLPSYADTITVSGTTTITSVTASWPNRRVTLIFSGILTFTDGSNLKLNSNFVTSADDTITLVCDGTNWYETSRSVN